MLKRALAALIALLIAFLVVVALQPGEFTVERSTSVNAPPATVFSQVSDFHNWKAWSPWEKLDPAMQKTIAGAGVGSTYEWKGNEQVGEGKMTLTESQPSSHLRIKLEFLKPMEGESDTLFAFTPESAGTRVSWKMTGKNNFVGKMFCLFMNMDKMVGGDFEKGLFALKTAAEAAAR